MTELELQLRSRYEYLQREEVWRQMLHAPEEPDWAWASDTSAPPIHTRIHLDFVDLSRLVIKAIVNHRAFDSIENHAKAFEDLPEPRLNFKRNNLNAGYDLALPKETPQRSFPWILWWFRMGVLNQAQSGRVNCPVRPDRFFCSLKIPTCGEAHVKSIESWPVDCLFYRTVRELEAIRRQIKSIRDRATLKQAFSGFPKVLYEKELFLALLRS